MKTILFAFALVIGALGSASAQLLPPGGQELTMGHVLVNVTSVDAHRKFWMECFDAKAITAGKLQGVTIPGLVVLFRAQPPTGPGEGEIINHLGLKLNKLADFTARFDKGGWQYDP